MGVCPVVDDGVVIVEANPTVKENFRVLVGCISDGDLRRLPDGTWVEGVEVFRRLYAAVGFTRLAAVSRLRQQFPGLQVAGSWSPYFFLNKFPVPMM